MTRPVRIVPAILTDDPQTLAKLIRQAETFTDYVQIDIMDGKFVPSRSVTWESLAGLSTKLHWEVHLMVQQPEDYLGSFKQVGALKAVFHYEATGKPEAVIGMSRQLGLGVGLAINPETPVSAVLPLIKGVDSILLLAVHPGFYGAKFIPEVLGKIAEIRAVRPDIEIGIDGGIKEGNIVQVARSGVDAICVGSAIFLQPDPAASYRRLVSLVAKTSRSAAD
ncbi:MAG: ribulose-phosphate 3-epimerase [Chloroflexi bacterium]|nr:ribulose-phosphate 3-epimerase [Chloroflexota bacterium]